MLVRRRGALLLAAFLAADVGFAVAACSTSSPEESSGVDASTEASPDAAKDNAVATPDGGTEGGGNCSPANTKCDLVLQNCPAQQECVTGATGTECQPVATSQQLPVGRACCPDPSGSVNPCLPGLTCIGELCVDGGPKSARCTPACCKGNDQACGKSDPEGISGACDLTIKDPNTDKLLFDVCTYRERCKPFRAEPCKVNETCLVEDSQGTAACIGSNGKTNRQPCTAGNDCADGLTCYGEGDAGKTCHTVCLFPGSTHPFDASVEEGGPGLGGCPVGEVCDISFSNRPSWYAYCSRDGG